MSGLDIIRAWKDEGYRNSLSDADRATLPDNPAGTVELTDDELNAVAGGTLTCLFTDCSTPGDAHAYNGGQGDITAGRARNPR